MSLALEGQHALVAGAGRGIGRAAALDLARAGARLTLTARTRDELEAVANEITAAGGSARVLPADIAEAEAVEKLVAEAVSDQPLDICVNSAGINRPGPTLELSLQDFDEVMRVNLRGTFLLSRAAGAAMLRAARGGRIVHVSSQMGSVGYPGRAAYCASKHAVNGLTKALAVEWAPHQITVNAVAPTFIETPLTAPMLANPEFRADVLQRIPMGRIGGVEEVAAAITFLASPAASLITGTILAVDGGWVAW